MSQVHQVVRAVPLDHASTNIKYRISGAAAEIRRGCVQGTGPYKTMLATFGYELLNTYYHYLPSYYGPNCKSGAPSD